MKKFIKRCHEYINNMKLYDFALLKFCLISLGMMLGLFVKDKYKKPCFFASFTVFMASYVHIMTEFLEAVFKKDWKAY